MRRRVVGCAALAVALALLGLFRAWAADDDRSREPQHTRAVRALIAEPLAGGNLILVTHQVNVTALTGIVPATGEMIVLSPDSRGGFTIVGRLGATDVSES